MAAAAAKRIIDTICGGAVESLLIGLVENQTISEDYEQSAPERRNLIRVCAELSLFIDDRIPLQRFTP